MNASLSLAFVAGMLAAVNPCAFSLLPAYVGLFLHVDDSTAPIRQRLWRVVVTTTSVSAGFVVVFVALGLLLDRLSSTARERLPWLTLAIGVVLVGVGLAVVAGWKFRSPVPAVRVTSRRPAIAMFLYGVGYGTASMSCTLGPFLAVTATAGSESVLSGLSTYFAYAAGMGLVVGAVAVASAAARPTAVQGMRRLSRWSGRLGGALMVASGFYAIWYARWELNVYGGDLATGRVVKWGERFRADVAQRIETLGPLRSAFLLMAVPLALFILRASTRAEVQIPRDQ